MRPCGTMETMRRVEGMLWLAGFVIVGAASLTRPPAPALCVTMEDLRRPPPAMPPAVDAMEALQMHSLPGASGLDARRGQASDTDIGLPGSASLLTRFSPVNSYIPPPIVARPRLGRDESADAGAFGFELKTDPLHAFAVEQPSLGWLADDVLGRGQSRGSGASGSSRETVALPGRESDPFGGGWPVTGGL